MYKRQVDEEFARVKIHHDAAQIENNIFIQNVHLSCAGERVPQDLSLIHIYCDENIRLLEQAFGVTAICRGTEVKLTGGEAVSYTHLDVYKRQRHTHGLGKLLLRQPARTAQFRDFRLHGTCSPLYLSLIHI